jgi:hypothetical protein
MEFRCTCGTDKVKLALEWPVRQSLTVHALRHSRHVNARKARCTEQNQKQRKATHDSLDYLWCR